MKPLKLVLEEIAVESFDMSRGGGAQPGTVVGLAAPPRDASNVCWTDEWNGGCAETGITIWCDPNCGDTVSDGPTGANSCQLTDDC